MSVLRLRVLILLIACAVGLVSCQWEAKKPSFLVIAIDSLPFDSIHCNETEKWHGFKTACDQMIRFTHAYTPSVLAAPAMASLLTGKYPFENGVWNNGNTFLSAKFRTSAEVAFEQGYRTSFISGGPPIWKKSGLDQGFEIFDDNISVDYGKYYRPVNENFRAFQEWMSSAVKDSPFFSFIYLSDLQFPDMPTVGNDGYAREATYDGQLHAIDESLENFFVYLKQKNYWQDTWIVIVGLNGTSQESREKSFGATNLFHENTNVVLFVKPPQRNSDTRFAWTVDANVILTDVGRTILELLGQVYHETNNTLFKTASLKEILSENNDFKQDRILLMESGWPQWRKLGHSLFALQKENYLLLYENPPKLFNTLIDRNEIYPINIKQASMQVLTQTAEQLISLMNDDDNAKVSEEVIEKYRLARLFFNQKDYNDDILSQLRQFVKKTNDIEMIGWLARASLAKQNWKEFLSLGTELRQSDWTWVASKNLGLTSLAPNSCVGLFDNIARLEEIKDPEVVCNDPLILDLIGWIKNRRKSDMVFYRETFLKSYKNFKTDLEIQRLNMENGNVWDVAKDKISRPQNIEMILSLADFIKYKKLLDREF